MSTCSEKRAWITVSFPLNIFPEPIPELPAHFSVDHKGGRDYLYKEVEHYDVCKVSCGIRPEEEWVEHYFLREEHSVWAWYEVAPVTGKASPEERKALATYQRDMKAWEGKWVPGGLEDSEIPDILVHLYLASYSAKTQHLSVSGDYANITFVVKWSQPKSKLGFCRELFKWTKDMNRLGLDYKIIRERP